MRKTQLLGVRINKGKMNTDAKAIKIIIRVCRLVCLAPQCVCVYLRYLGEKDTLSHIRV